MANITAWDGGRLGKNLSVADTGSGATFPSTTFSSECYKIRLSGNKSYFFRIGDGVQTAVIGDALLPANVVDYFNVSPGQQLAAISTSTTTGWISISEIY